MALIQAVGFGAQSVLVDTAATTLSGGVTYNTTTKRSGSASLRVQLTSGVASAQTMTVSSLSYTQFYMLVASRPTTSARTFLGSSVSPQRHLRLNPDGTIAMYASGVLVATGTATLTDTTHWYRINVRMANGTNVAVVRVDGVDDIVASPSSWSMSGVVGANDTFADTYDIYYADFAQDSTAFPPDNLKVVWGKPISDNARGAWTGGVGGTTNLFDAVNNTPPIGTATETDLTQIESASGSGTDTYDVNCESYTTLGIGASDTIYAVQGGIVHGEDVATGTKTGTFQVLSNPAEGSSTAFNFGNDGGALGTFPTNWADTLSSLMSSPSVTLGTSPVLRVVKTDTGTRVASVCQMGYYVAYVPAVVATTPVIPFRNINQAVVRGAYY